jgi:hypothetical protein
MKPISRKRLHLGTETLRTLESNDLARVIGGVDMGDGTGGGGGDNGQAFINITKGHSCSFNIGACCGNK